MPLGFVQPEMGEHPVVNHAQSFQQTKTVVFFLYCFLLFSLPPIIFSLHPFNLSLHPPTFLYLPHSDPTGVRSSSLLFRYRHPFGLYERTLQPTHTAYPPTHPTHLPPTSELDLVWPPVVFGRRPPGEPSPALVSSVARKAHLDHQATARIRAAQARGEAMVDAALQLKPQAPAQAGDPVESDTQMDKGFTPAILLQSQTPRDECLLEVVLGGHTRCDTLDETEAYVASSIERILAGSE